MSRRTSQLRRVANDPQLLWDVGRLAVEDALVELRDMRVSVLGRNNGAVIKERDGSNSDVIRLGAEDVLRIGLLAIADHIDGI